MRASAALAWSEALTLLPEHGAPEELFASVQAQFSEAEMVNLTLAVIAINGWNRIGVGFNLQHPTASETIAA